MNTTTQGYGEFIKRHRLASGFKSQRSLAEKTGINHATISRIEKEEQKPEKRTLQTLAEYLTTTSYVELMVKCGHWDDEELLEGIVEDPKPPMSVREFEQQKTPASKEEEFLKGLDLAEDELIQKYNMKIDGQPLTKEETQGIIAYIRSLREVKS